MRFKNIISEKGGWSKMMRLINSLKTLKLSFLVWKEFNINFKFVISKMLEQKLIDILAGKDLSGKKNEKTFEENFRAYVCWLRKFEDLIN